MQLDEKTYARYETRAPELLDAVTSGEAERIMRRDDATGFCVKFEDGLCGIHRRYGTDFLGDACHFYPRVTRALGEGAQAAVVQTAALSCPEVARLVLFSDAPFAHTEAAFERVPHTLKNYLPAGLDAQAALSVHRLFLEMVEEEPSPAFAVMRLYAASEALMRQPFSAWPEAVPFYLREAAARLPAPELKAEDPFNLLHALMGLMVATRRPLQPRMRAVVDSMEKALCCTLDWQQVMIATGAGSLPAWQAMAQRWKREWEAAYIPVLRRFLQSQMAVALYPFAGFGDTLADRATVFGVRFAWIRLALMSGSTEAGRVLTPDEIVAIIQPLSRFMDHLGDPALLLAICGETGWNKPTRLRALVE